MKSKKKKKIKYTYKTVDDVLVGWCVLYWLGFFCEVILLQESGMKRGSLNMQTKSSVKV